MKNTSLCDTVLFVLGGLNYGENILKTTEYVSPGSETAQGPDLPYGLSGACIAAINESTLILVGGYSNEPADSIRKSWYFDIESETWSEGPEMKNDHKSHSCGVFDGPNGRIVVTVTNGNVDNSTELLFLDKPDQWLKGTICSDVFSSSKFKLSKPKRSSNSSFSGSKNPYELEGSILSSMFWKA